MSKYTEALPNFSVEEVAKKYEASTFSVRTAISSLLIGNDTSFLVSSVDMEKARKLAEEQGKEKVDEIFGISFCKMNPESSLGVLGAMFDLFNSKSEPIIYQAFKVSLALSLCSRGQDFIEEILSLVEDIRNGQPLF